ncbi:MAG: peptidyl-tRNA hydrolase [Methanobacteriota archaeon]|nr:MAG: peptidyl-tRNA hydrolase [Euryarchaeota archaeon]
MRIPFVKTTNFEAKQVIVLRTDLKMGKGKMVAQGAHAAVRAAFKAKRQHPQWFDRWERLGSKKVVCKVNSEEELRGLFQQAQSKKLPVSIINDAGLTQLEPGTTTAIAIGPAPADQVDAITKALKLL